jgi:hypothetical protein
LVGVGEIVARGPVDGRHERRRIDLELWSATRWMAVVKLLVDVKLRVNGWSTAVIEYIINYSGRRIGSRIWISTMRLLFIGWSSLLLLVQELRDFAMNLRSRTVLRCPYGTVQERVGLRIQVLSMWLRQIV